MGRPSETAEQSSKSHQRQTRAIEDQRQLNRKRAKLRQSDSFEVLVLIVISKSPNEQRELFYGSSLRRTILVGCNRKRFEAVGSWSVLNQVPSTWVSTKKGTDKLYSTCTRLCSRVMHDPSAPCQPRVLITFLILERLYSPVRMSFSSSRSTTENNSGWSPSSLLPSSSSSWTVESCWGVVCATIRNNFSTRLPERMGS